MGYFKITSLTAKLPKRHNDKDKTLKIEYREKFSQKFYDLAPSATMYLSSPSLPVNLHKLRMNGLVSIVEIGKNTFMKLSNPTNIKKVEVTPVEVVEETAPLPVVVEVTSEPKKIIKRKLEE